VRVGIIGNLLRDVIRPPGTVQIGGTAYYSGMTASRLGYEVRLLSRVGVDYPIGWLNDLEREGVELILQYSEESTVFENTYKAGRRRQRLLGDAGRIEWDERFGGCDLVHVGPLFIEVSPDVIERLSCDLVSLDVQGFIRKTRDDGTIIHSRWRDMDRCLSRVDIVHAGLDEARYICHSTRGNLNGFDLLRLGPKVVVFTDGFRGSYVFHVDTCHQIPAYRMRSLYPTGAGDVYSAAFLIKYFETGEPRLSGYFASAAASLLVEKGMGGITDRGVVEERMGKLVHQNKEPGLEGADRHRGL